MKPKCTEATESFWVNIYWIIWCTDGEQHLTLHSKVSCECSVKTCRCLFLFSRSKLNFLHWPGTSLTAAFKCGNSSWASQHFPFIDSKKIRWLNNNKLQRASINKSLRTEFGASLAVLLRYIVSFFLLAVHRFTTQILTLRKLKKTELRGSTWNTDKHMSLHFVTHDVNLP